MFGHSCYGAHGKRSFQISGPARDWPATRREEEIDDAINKYLKIKLSSPHFTQSPFWKKMVSFSTYIMGTDFPK